MTKRLNSKHKVDRRLKVNLWGRPKSPFNSRNYKPGQHGKTTRSKISDYGIQLQAKQKLKFYYGNMNERQFRNFYRKALKKRGNTTENLIGFQPVILLAATNSLSEANFVAPYRLIGDTALSVDKEIIFSTLFSMAASTTFCDPTIFVLITCKNC